MDRNVSQLEKELHRWRTTTYAFEIISFVLLGELSLNINLMYDDFK